MARTTSNPAHTVDDYMQLSYQMVVYWDEDCWAAEFPELPGLIAAHETWDGLRASVDDAKRTWFEMALRYGDPIPEPSQAQAEYSGNLRVRLPKSLHARAVRAAQRDEVSLNMFVVAAIAQAVARQ